MDKALRFPTFGRRHFLASGMAASLVAPTLSKADMAAHDPLPVSPEQALERLMEGNSRYVAGAPLRADYSKDRVTRALGQYPFAAIVSCADSRVAPELIFDQPPGNLFVVRVAGNIISEEGLASLEFGATALGIKTVIVLGHTACGAVNAAISVVEGGDMPGGHLPSLVDAISPAVRVAMMSDPSDLLVAATAENARLGARKVEESPPILSDLTMSGRLIAKSAVYDIATGRVTLV